MSRKIFVSYKYADSYVQPLAHVQGFTTARDYVDLLHAHFDANDHIIKGENDGESLAGFKDETIASKLRDKIFDSSLTIVLVSKNMQDLSMNESDQWIPWEISYSLKEMTRDGRTSSTNAMLAVVLPDENGSYEYFIQPLGCTNCGSIRYHNDSLFKILGGNMFNRKQPKIATCPNGVCGQLHTGSDHSYIYPIQWDYFIRNINGYLDMATQINAVKTDYNIQKVV